MPNSSTSSSEPGGAGPGEASGASRDAARWRRFVRLFAATLAGLCLFVYGFVLIVDPYDTLPFSPEFEREPISTNARFSFPALAASPRFDSAIIGTSTSRLLRPQALDALFGARFVNLAMNSATAYEQQQIFELFVRHHPTPKAVIIGIDIVWCEVGEDPPRFTFRPFPPWLYDGEPWNDALYLFNRSAVEQAGRQAARAVGLRAPKYGLDGYTNFLPPQSEYDLDKVRRGLYGGTEPKRHEPATPPPDGYADYRRDLRFPTHAQLAAMLDRLPAQTLKLVYFVPYHHYHQARPGTQSAARWAECKQRIGALVDGRQNAHLVDFMIASPLTLEDANYWDALHYGTTTAQRLAEALHDATAAQTGAGRLYDYLAGAKQP